MKNQLHKRYFREFKSDFYKYAAIFFIMIVMIGEGSGFFVAINSLKKGYRESFQKNRIEDGNFRLSKALTEEERLEAEKEGIRLFEQFSRDIPMLVKASGTPKNDEKGLKVRLYKNRTELNLATLIEGRLPQKQGEIALDRTVARNKGLVLNDSLVTEKRGREFVITGLISLPDYTAQFESNQDMMFDASSFGTAIIGDEDFASFEKEGLRYTYTFCYEKKPESVKEEKERGDELVKNLGSFLDIEEFVPAYLNQGITFTGEDFESDTVMIRVFLYVVLSIVAFVIAITMNHTISKEAEVIGSLLALGYRKGEIIRHYMTMPLLVALISAAVGNILGYTWLKDLNYGLYTTSYSLPDYDIAWEPSAFLETTLSSFFILLFITYFSIRRKMSLPPLRFLTHDLKKKGRGKNLGLSPKLPFFLRFRLRVMIQNVGNYLMLFVGVLFAYFLLMFSLVFPAMMEHFEDSLKGNMLAEYQYILNLSPKLAKRPELLGGLITKEKTAEKFSLRVLETDGSIGRAEEIYVYGVKEDSAYVKACPKDGSIIISKMMADKYRLKVGDELRLKEKYEAKFYEFQIEKISPYEGSLSVFLEEGAFRERFDLAEGFFSGYFSNKPLTDLDEAYVGAVLDLKTMTKITRQMRVSLGKLLDIITIFAVLIFAILIYLLTKTIIEKNQASISMAKIMGYRNQEIRKLYVGPTTFMMVSFLLIGLPVIKLGMRELFVYLFREKIKGWLPLHITKREDMILFFLGLMTYFVVSLFEYRRIKRIPMSVALKSAE